MHLEIITLIENLLLPSKFHLSWSQFRAMHYFYDKYDHQSEKHLLR